MNILIDLLPVKVKIDGAEYGINSDFRTSMLFEMMMQDRNLDDKSKIVQSLDLYYPKIPSNIEKAIDEVLWFYKCGKGLTSTDEIAFKHPAQFPATTTTSEVCVVLPASCPSALQAVWKNSCRTLDRMDSLPP